MNVLIIGDHPNSPGGIATYTKKLLNTFSIYNVDYITLHNFGEVPEISGAIYDFGIECLWSSKMSFLEKVAYRIKYDTFELRASKIINSNNYDVIIISNPRYIMACKNSNARIILIQHAEIDRWLKMNYYFNYKFMRKRIHRLLNSKKVTIVTPAPQYSPKLHDIFPNAKIELIRSGYNISSIIEKPINKKIIMHARIVNKIKRFDLAIETMKYLPDFELAIYGDGEDYDFIKELVTKNKLNNVSIYPSTNNIIQILHDFSFFFLTSETEGYSYSLIEAKCEGLIPLVRDKIFFASDATLPSLFISENAEENAQIVKNAYENLSELRLWLNEDKNKYSIQNFEKFWQQIVENK